MLAGGQGGDKEGKEGSISKVLYYWLPLPQKHSWQVGHTAPTLPASQPCGVTAPRKGPCGPEGRMYLPGSSNSCLSLVTPPSVDS